MIDQFVWLALIVLFLTIEAVVPQLVTIWFAVGALGALIAAMFKVDVWWQIGVFLAITTVALICTRPLVRKERAKKVATNADRIIGCICLVTEALDTFSGTGAVMINGQVWSAKEPDGKPIPIHAKVRVLAIEGSHVVVESAMPEANES